MPYDTNLAERIRWVLVDDGVTEREMFGGIAFMLHGNMVCGVIRDSLLLRLGPEGSAAALAEDEHTRPMDFTGKPMRSMMLVEPLGIERDEDLAAWIERARSFVGTLPPKS
jgi:TfoX/Sxy family transcriptional regulator of competence genes